MLWVVRWLPEGSSSSLWQSNPSWISNLNCTAVHPLRMNIQTVTLDQQKLVWQISATALSIQPHVIKAQVTHRCTWMIEEKLQRCANAQASTGNSLKLNLTGISSLLSTKGLFMFSYTRGCEHILWRKESALQGNAALLVPFCLTDKSWVQGSTASKRPIAAALQQRG